MQLGLIFSEFHVSVYWFHINYFFTDRTLLILLLEKDLLHVAVNRSCLTHGLEFKWLCDKARVFYCQFFKEFISSVPHTKSESFQSKTKIKLFNNNIHIALVSYYSGTVAGTPYFFINGVFASHASSSWSVEQWKQLIDSLLQRN